jgi:O-antigen ligase
MSARPQQTSAASTTRSQQQPAPASDAPRGGLRRAGWLIEPGFVLGVALLASAGGVRGSFLLVAVPAFWLARRWRCADRLLGRTPYDAPIAVLLLTLPLWLLPVVDWSAAAPKIAGILGGIAVVYALTRAGDSPPRLVMLTSLAALVLEGLVIATALVGTNWSAAEKIDIFQPVVQHLPVLVRTVSRGSANGGVNPNEVGGAAVLVLPLALVVAGRWRVRSTRWFDRLSGALALSGAALLACVLLFSQSRSAYAGLLCETVFLGMVALTSGLRARTRAVALATAVLAGLAHASGLDSVASRLELWQRGLRMVGDVPLTGIGPGQFDLVLHRLFPPLLVRDDVYVAHAHNWFIQLALDLGLPGAAAMLWLLWRFLRVVAVAASRSPEPRLRRLAVALAAGMLGYVAFGLTDAIALGARGGLGLWVILGLGAALWRTACAAEHELAAS